MPVLNSSTSVQMVSWQPCHQTHVTMAVLSPSRLWTTCRILARPCIVPQLHSSSSLRPPLSAPTGLSGVRSNPATTATVFASRAPASISWTRLLDVLSRSGGTVVRRWTRASLMNYKWNLDCLHPLHPPRLLSWRHTSRPSEAWRSRLPSSTPTLSHNEGDEGSAGTLGEARQKCIYLTQWNRPTSCAGGGACPCETLNWTYDCDMLIMCCCCDHNTKPVRAAPLFVTRDRWLMLFWLFLFIKIETLDCNSPTLSSTSRIRSFTRSVNTRLSLKGAEQHRPPAPHPLSSEDWTLAEVQWWTPCSSCFPLKTSLISRLKHAHVTNVCLNSGVRYLRAAS